MTPPQNQARHDPRLDNRHNARVGDLPALCDVKLAKLIAGCEPLERPIRDQVALAEAEGGEIRAPFDLVLLHCEAPLHG